MSDSDFDAADECRGHFDEAALAIGTVSAFSPLAPEGGLTAWGTHLFGIVYCDGDLEALGPPASWPDAKLGYDPETRAPPAFTGQYAGPESGPDTTAFDYGRCESGPMGGFDYDSGGSSGGGFDYSGNGGSSGDGAADSSSD
jgi:hypothetical protein